MPMDRTAYYADASTPAALATITAAMADAEADQVAVRAIQTYKWANAAARTAQTGMSEGDIGDQADTDVQYRYSGSAWAAVGISARKQLDTTNSTVTPSIQFGIGKITGTATTFISEAVTFPTAFTTVPSVTGGVMGVKATGAFNEAGTTGTLGYFNATAVSTTGYTGFIISQSGNLDNTKDYYYSWIAVGI